jgi:hypothetical protein
MRLGASQEGHDAAVLEHPTHRFLSVCFAVAVCPLSAKYYFDLGWFGDNAGLNLHVVVVVGEISTMLARHRLK